MPSPIQSAELELDLGRYTLMRAGRSVRLEKQPMELLILLVEKRGQLVTREEIVSRIWGNGVFLDTERSINTAILKIRFALHDNPDDPHSIETVVGKGYRFIAPITVIASDSAPASAEELLPPVTLPRSKWRSPAIVAMALLICIALIVFAFGRKWLRTTSGQRPIQSVAVLPLENLSGDPAQEYFADGMTEALITDLAKISGLRVISRTSVLHYRGSGKILPEIARELKVDAIVEGSVARSNGRVRITAQLVEAATDRHLWAETYERSSTDVLAIEDEVARAIARQVNSRFAAQEQIPSGERPFNVEAQDAYLNGLHEADNYTRESLNKSVEYFQEAVEKDPKFAQAWAGLAHSFDLLALFHYGPAQEFAAKAEASALRSIELDNNLSEAHGALGEVLLHRGAWSEGEKELRRSIALNPSNALAHQSLGYLLAGVMRRFDEGILHMTRARELDPLSPSKQNSLGAAFYWAGRYDRALSAFREVSDGDGNTERRHRRMAEIYERKGMQREAVEELVRALELTGRDRLAASVARTYRSSGYAGARRAFFLGDIREREPRAKRADALGNAWWVATDYASIGDKDKAFQWLDKAFTEGDVMLMYLKVEGQFENLRTDSRFPALLRRAGLS